MNGDNLSHKMMLRNNYPDVLNFFDGFPETFYYFLVAMIYFNRIIVEN